MRFFNRFITAVLSERSWFRKQFITLLFVGCLLSDNFVSYADENILINSENLTVNTSKNTAIFSGNVVLWFQDMILKTENVTIIYEKDNGREKIDKIIMEGRVIAYREKDQETLIAGNAIYYADQQKLELMDNVKINRNDHILKTKKLIYYVKLENITK